jgi:hypothetical protein
MTNYTGWAKTAIAPFIPVILVINSKLPYPFSTYVILKKNIRSSGNNYSPTIL